MNVLLERTRSLLIAVPAVATALTLPAGSYFEYTALALLALLLTRIGDLFPKAATVLLIAEWIYFGWFASLYEGMLFLLPFASLLKVNTLKLSPAAAGAWTIAGTASLLLALHDRERFLIAAVLLIWAMTASILYIVNRYERKRLHVEMLYEELAESHEQLQAARRRLLDYASQIEQYAQVEERNRIGKQIHDDLGHQLIRLKMMSEASLQLFDIDPSKAKATLTQIRDQLGDSMDRMRRTVRRLADTDDRDARRYALDRLVAESGEAFGIPVRFEARGIPRPLYPSIEFMLYNNAREAITNAVRHGGATAIDVVLDYRENEASLTVSNNGKLPEGEIEAGLGIRGMKERLALIGGKLEWRLDDRFAITSIVPLTGETTETRTKTREER
ncbi:sensor histidine kinase [Paenibacillus sp. NPDC058071]|uniref:sensor histidine kinase n=1 Tax=Paenibacillus sp. NPDC058071 TaxID=3346326 RepID=UPI0036D8EB58